jgi:TRAP-type C4-dicarboxylate transport system permease large subunit
VLLLDRLLSRGRVEEAPDHAAHRQPGIERSVRYATNEALGHIGALLSLMMLSLSVGGVIERSEVMSAFPQVFDSHWTAMAFLVVVKVLIGAVMDPFGAVVLVSGTLAPIAAANHIDPVHFWMMVLVAFELGYLFPPVALNQLLTRQVIGEAEVATADQEVAHRGLYHRHERWILPLAVMSIALLVVAFGPLLVQDYPPFAFIGQLFLPAAP